jgi:hypothetical protein|tara:strand:+ start:88 stop:378 length:291 start_codon:yes stop_codon:yes gene_type:complete
MKKEKQSKFGKDYEKVYDQTLDFIEEKKDEWVTMNSKAVMFSLLTCIMQMTYDLMIGYNELDKKEFYKFVSVAIQDVEENHHKQKEVEEIEELITT